MAQLVKNPPAMWETRVHSLSWEDPLEKGTATHSSILAGRIPQSMGSQRVGHDKATFTFIFLIVNSWSLLYLNSIIFLVTRDLSIFHHQNKVLGGLTSPDFKDYIKHVVPS